MKNTEFLMNELNIDFNVLTSEFIRDLPIHLQLLTFVENNSNSDHLTKYFSTGNELKYNGEDMEILSIDSDSLIVYNSSISENIKISATEALVQNGYLEEGKEYNFDESIDFESEYYIEVLNRIEDTLNSLVFDKEIYIEYSKDSGEDYIINNINKYRLQDLKSLISEEI